jgi:predicted ribosome quality control (RQC) complex YloA/Tae2 family protein
MDPKQELTSVDLAALTSELGSYEGAKVDKAYLYGDDFLRLKLRDFDRGRVELLVEVGDVKRTHVAAPERVPDAPGRPPNFAMMLRNRLSGADFVGVEQFEFDRIVEFKFERDDENTIIVAELFGPGNLAVLDPNREVIDCLDTVRLKSRTVAPGAQYEFPESQVNPLEMSYEAFAAFMDDSDSDVVRTLATQLNFGGLYAEELCTRAGVDKTLDIAEADESQYEPLYAAIEELAVDVRTGAVDPRVYYDSDEDGVASETRREGGGEAAGAKRVDVTPFPLDEYADLESEAFDTFNDAVDDYFHHLDLTEDEEAGGSGPDRPDFEAEIEKQNRIIEQQEQAIEGFERDAEAEREKAELLYAEYGLVDEILSTISEARANDVPWEDIEAKFEQGAEQGIDAAEAVQRIDGENGRVTVRIDGTNVTLDAAEGVEHNADRLYTEAKRIQDKKEGAKAAIEDTREALEDVKRRREQWEDREQETDDEDEDEDEDVDWLSEPSIPVRKSEQWFERFRWFHTSDGFLVIGGRDADQNEELVKKYLEPGDRFVHAQAHGGPVTILKATGPSESARDVDIPESSEREAAQFAVSNSSVWKDGRYSGDAYAVDHDQVSKTPESGEYLEKGSFAIRGDRDYYRDVGVGAAIGITCEPSTRVVGGPPAAIREQAETLIGVEPGRYAQGDVAKRIYRQFRERFEDTSFVRKVASPDLIQHFLPPGTSRIKDE